MVSGGYDDQSQEEDDGQFDDQTDAEKRQVGVFEGDYNVT